jgi:L-fuculose-phosphate aldolase
MLDTSCDILREAYNRGWITTRDGNISVRLSGQNFFHISPSGVRKNLLNSNHFIKLSIPELNRKWINDSDQAFSKGLIPSGELPMHSDLQKNHNEDRVVLHLHPTYTIGAMKKGIDLQHLAREFPELKRYTRVGKNLPIIEPVSLELATAVSSAFELKNNGSISFNIVGLDRHGIVSIDRDPWLAFEHVERLEHICKIYLI